MKKVRAFTLIELLVVILILGILLAIAIPAYLNSVKDSRHKTANSNAKAIATAVQSAYVKANGDTYVGKGLANAIVLEELGGSIPTNPCTGTATAADYTVTLTAPRAEITAVAGTNCTAAELKTIVLGN